MKKMLIVLAVIIGFSKSSAVAQNFAENQTKAKNKGMVHLSLAF